MGHLPGRVGGDHGRALEDDLAEDAPCHRNGLRRVPLLVAHAGHDGHVTRRSGPRAFIVVVTQDDRDVRGTPNEAEGRVADGHEHVVQLGRGTDSLVGLVEGAQPVPVTLDRPLDASQLVDLAHRQHASAGVGVLLPGDGQSHHLLPAPQLNDVARLESDLAPPPVLEDDMLVAALDRRSVRRSQVTQDIPLAVEHDARVIA